MKEDLIIAGESKTYSNNNDLLIINKMIFVLKALMNFKIYRITTIVAERKEASSLNNFNILLKLL